jgi:hypothetical protein
MSRITDAPFAGRRCEAVIRTVAPAFVTAILLIPRDFALSVTAVTPRECGEVLRAILDE